MHTDDERNDMVVLGPALNAASEEHQNLSSVHINSRTGALYSGQTHRERGREPMRDGSTARGLRLRMHASRTNTRTAQVYAYRSLVSFIYISSQFRNTSREIKRHCHLSSQLLPANSC